MYEPDVEEIVSYLSLKLNKIFYDREFVSCVSNDFHKLKSKNNKCCVLVFPALGPVYHRALKYQAKAFDLATFVLYGGTFRITAVCQKEYLLNEITQEKPEEKKMSSEPVVPQDGTVRRKRPERQLYVPPAQRKLVLNKEAKSEVQNCGGYGPSSSSEGLRPKLEPSCSRTKKLADDKIHKERRQGSKVQPCKKTTKSDEKITQVEVDSRKENIDEFAKRILSLHDLMHLNFLKLPNYSGNRGRIIDDNAISLKNFHECCCEFHQYLISKCENNLQFCIPIYCLNDMNFLLFLIDNYCCWQPVSTDNLINFEGILQNNCAIPFFNYIKNADDSDFLKGDLTNNFTLNQIKLCTKIKTYEGERSGLVKVNTVGDVCEVEAIFNEDFDVGNLLKIVCDNEPFENIVDLTAYAMGHYFRIPAVDGSEFFHICDQSHDVHKCYMEVKQKLTRENVTDQEKTCKSESTQPAVQNNINNNGIKDVVAQQEKKLDTAPVAVTKTEVKTAHKEILDSKKRSEHEEEKEIMRKAKENINRKTRPIMKYSDDSDDLLRIDKQDNINNWEDLFDDDGQIQEELLTEIVQKVGKDMSIVKATEDYTPYMQKPSEDLEHVVEIYNFPPSLSTGDIIHAFSMFDSESMYIVWVNDTHALLVLGSAIQAQRAMEVKNPLIRVRPMTIASPGALAMASQYDLKPAMKRPQTNLQTARRLITHHLGTKSQVTKEQNAMEREHLRKAREQRNITRQNEKDAWEGNIRSSLRQ